MSLLEQCNICCGDGYINRHANSPDVKCAACDGKGLVDALWPEPPQWQPISTAPRDGTPILCFSPDALGQGFSDQSGIDVLWWEDGNWTYDGDSRVTIDLPTHWMPLPRAPK